MTDVAVLSFELPTAPLLAASTALGGVATSAATAAQSASTFTAGMAAAAAQTSVLMAATAAQTSALRAQAASTAAAAAQISALQAQAAKVVASLNPQDEAYKRLNVQLQQYTTLQKAGLLTSDQVAKASTLARGGYDSEVLALNKVAAAHGHGGAAANNNAIATLELFHVTRSLTEQFAMGVSPLRALTMEMGRIMTLFQFAGGPSGVLSLIGSGISKVGALITSALLNPFIALPAVIAVVATGGLVAFGAWESKLGEMQKALNGLGRSTGLTLDQLGALAEKGAARGNISTGSAVDIATQAAATGKIAPDMIGRILDDTKQFAKATGQGIGAAGSQLVQSLADPTKGAQDLDKALGFLNDTTKQTIIELDASGKRAEAQDVFLKALNADTATASDRTWTWTKMWQNLGDVASSALAHVGQFVTSNFDPSLQQKYDAARAAVQAGPAQRSGAMLLGAAYGPRQTQASQASALARTAETTAEQLALQNYAASLKGAQAQAAEMSKQSGDLVRSLSSESTAYQKLTEDLDLLKGTNAGAVGEMKGGVDVYGRAATGAQLYAQTVEQATHAHDTFITSFQREIAAGQIEIESIGARTLAEKAAVDVARERLALMGQQITASEEQAKVDQKLNEVLAQANRQVADNSRQVKNAAETAGLSGLALQKVQLDQEYKLLLEQAGTSHTITMRAPAPPTPVAKGPPRLDFSMGPSAAEPQFDDGAIQIGKVAAAASSAAPAMQTYTKTIVDGGNASQIAADKAQKWATIVENATKPAIDNATKSIDAQGKMLDVQIATFGQSTGAIAAATEKQQLLNQFASEGITEASIGSAAYAKLSESIGGVARKTGEAATASEAFAEKQRTVIGTMDLMRSASTDALSTFADDLVQGKSAMQALGDATKNVLNDILRFAENSFVASLFGQSGTTGSTSLFGSGIAGFLGKLVGLGGGAEPATGGSGLVGGLNFANPVGLASGGIMTSRGLAPLRRYAGGGVATSPQLAMFGEGDSNEAYVPLPDGKSIPVNIRGSGSIDRSSGGVVVNISNNHPGAEVSASPTTGASGQQQIEIMVTQIVAKSVSRNGLVGRTMQRQYGLGRLTGVRQ